MSVVIGIKEKKKTITKEIGLLKEKKSDIGKNNSKSRKKKSMLVGGVACCCVASRDLIVCRASSSVTAR
jgi:hypothetical protein